jgi:hypothetical protein
LLTRYAQLPNDIADLDRVRQQTQTARLIRNLLLVTGAKLDAISEEQPAGQFMPRFASIELQLHPSSNLLLVDVAQYEDRLDDPAERRKRFSDSIQW